MPDPSARGASVALCSCLDKNHGSVIWQCPNPAEQGGRCRGCRVRLGEPHPTWQVAQADLSATGESS